MSASHTTQGRHFLIGLTITAARMINVNHCRRRPDTGARPLARARIAMMVCLAVTVMSNKSCPVAADGDTVAEAVASHVAVLVSAGSTDDATDKATRALAQLAANASHRVLMYEVGVVPPLVALLTSGTDLAKASSASALGNLATTESLED